jgi:hypothetical protein
LSLLISVLIGNKQGLFDDIIGFEDVKALFKMAIKAERPVHLLLYGPPSSGKSLFMSSLTRLERSYYAVGSSSTKSGIFDYLFEGLFVIPPPSSKLGEIGEGIRSKVIDDFSLRESISICVRTSKIIGSITYDAVYYSGGYYEYAY